MSQAIFGLAGVVLGGILTGGFQLLLEHRREAAAGRAARRLMTHELFGVWSSVGAMLKKGRTPDKHTPERQARFLSTLEWERNRDVLARTLPNVEWQMLAYQAENTYVLRTLIYDLPPGSPIPDSIDVPEFRNLTAVAYETLTGHPPHDLLDEQEE